MIRKAPKVERKGRLSNGSVPVSIEREFAQDEIDFMRAMQRYKVDNRRPFPTCAEVLEIVKSLGYRKNDSPAKSDAAVTDLRRLCSSLLLERDNLQLAVSDLQEENDTLKASLGRLLQEDIAVNKPVMLRDFGKEPSIESLLSEIESGGA